jgi:hypothetical protein
MGETVHNRVIGLRHHIDATDIFETGYTMTIDTIAAFKSIATAHNSGLTALDIIKGQIEALRQAKVTFGKSKATCEIRTQCLDAYVAAFPGKAKKTLQNYVTAVVDAVNDGVEFSFSASKGKANDKTKGKSKTKAATEKDTTIYPLLAKLFGHESFKATMADIQAAYDNDEGDLWAIIQTMLEAEDYEITE